VAFILAGGKGERFWPRSRGDLPKQFLPILGDRTLLQRTEARARTVTGGGAVYVITGAAFAARVAEQLPDLPPDRILIEPEGRDTAPAIAFAMAVAVNRHPGSVAVVLPADHFVGDDESFAAACLTAARCAHEEGRLALLGVQPTRPETAYGYIVPGGPAGPGGWSPVARFREKPSPSEALDLLSEGTSLWNAGVFIWRPEVFVDALDRVQPAVREAAGMLAASPNDPAACQAYAALSPLSVDYGVLEKSADCAVVRATFAWDDVGNWAAVGRFAPTDGDRNVVRGHALAIESRGVTIDSPAGRLVVAFGLEDTVIVDSEDAVLVAPAARASDLKRVTEALRARGLGRYVDRSSGTLPLPEDAHVVDKPWGREIWWGDNGRYLAKVIEVSSGHSLSLQYHEEKHETMYFLRGQGSVAVGGERKAIRPGLVVDIPPGVVHRVEATTESVVLVEVSTAHPDDVVRLDDRYGRGDPQAAATRGA